MDFLKKESGLGHYLALALPLQVYHTHVHNGAKIGERLHHCHIWALIIAVHIELQRIKKKTTLFTNQEGGILNIALYGFVFKIIKNKSLIKGIKNLITNKMIQFAILHHTSRFY